MFLDGPHVLQPADLAFGNVVETLEETGETVAEPEMAPRAWGFMPSPENLEPGLVEALGVIKDALLKDTYVVRARYPVYLVSVCFAPKRRFESDRVFLVSAKEQARLRPLLRWWVASDLVSARPFSHLSSQLEKPHLYPPFVVDGKPIHPPL